MALEKFYMKSRHAASGKSNHSLRGLHGMSRFLYCTSEPAE